MSITKSVCFYNDGEFDRRSFTLLGLSAKSSDNSIGFFGTGFKYAIATLLRHGMSVCIATRSTVYNFTTAKATFRDKDYTAIYCNYDDEVVELPFTTHLGANWKLWQAYRELYTNAKDEGGGVCLANSDGSHSTNDVCVLVGGDNIAELVVIYNNHNKYFLNDNTPVICEGDRMRIVAKKHDGDNVVYYRTMYTGTKLDKPSHFTYDYTAKQELTEDRTLAHPWMLREHIGDVWTANMSYDMLIEHLPRISKMDVYEYNLDTSYHLVGPSKDFLRACAYLIEHHQSMPMWARDLYTKQLPFDKQITVYQPTRHQLALVKRAIAVLHHHRCMIDPTLVVLCVSLPDDTLGYYREGIIYISEAVFDLGFEKLLGTMYEEYLHHHEHVSDNSRHMQNLLIDKCAALMLEIYEIDTAD